MARTMRHQASASAERIGCRVMVLALLLGFGCGKTATTPPPAPKAQAKAESKPSADGTSRSVARAEPAANGKKRPSKVTRAKPGRRTARSHAAADSGTPSAAAEAAPAIDPDLAIERLVLFTEQGPLIVQVRITIDGIPFRAVREKLLDELIKLADRDNDGRATWEELLADPPRQFAQLFNQAGDRRRRKDLLQTSDSSRDGRISRDEARRFIGRHGGGTAFKLDSSLVEARLAARRSSIYQLLDTDMDDQLSKGELLAAGERLKIRDINDDDILTQAEMDEAPGGPAAEGMARTRSRHQAPPVASRLGSEADWDGLRLSFSELYLIDRQLHEDSFPLVPALATQLDPDGDGVVDNTGFDRLNVVPPHIGLVIGFGRSGDLPTVLELESLSAELGRAAEVVAAAPDGAILSLEGLRLRFAARDSLPAGTDLEIAQSQLAALDADKNGYLEQKEVPNDGLAPGARFADLDADGDGKVYAEEIADYARQQQAVQLSAVRAMAEEDSDVLFSLLDADHDGRLISRELRLAVERLAELDRDRDGSLGIDEVPSCITVSFDRGTSMANMPVVPRAAPADAAAPVGPTWFVHMDTNRDQEVSLREFPGGRDKFTLVDRDGNGFIDRAEAAKASAGE